MLMIQVYYCIFLISPIFVKLCIYFLSTLSLYLQLLIQSLIPIIIFLICTLSFYLITILYRLFFYALFASGRWHELDKNAPDQFSTELRPQSKRSSEFDAFVQSFWPSDEYAHLSPNSIHQPLLRIIQSRLLVYSRRCQCLDSCIESLKHWFPDLLAGKSFARYDRVPRSQ